MTKREIAYWTDEIEWRATMTEGIADRDSLALDPLHQGRADNLRVYGEHVFLFNGETLITVMHVPQQLRSALR